MRPIHIALTALFMLSVSATAGAVPCDHVDYQIDCGQTISVPMPSLTQTMDDYPGPGYFGYDAGEYVLEFTVPPALLQLDIIHSSQEDHAIFMMGPGQCDSDFVGWWDDTGWGTINGGLTIGGTYYFSVDAELPIPWDSYVHLSLMCNSNPYEFCAAGGDQDNDGLSGCDDPDCAEYFTCQSAENCFNIVDDDGDGFADCDDPECYSVGPCHPEDCHDGIDNNNDGLVDCIDPDPYCVSISQCPEMDCFDGLDNDSDTLIDCNDPDCIGIVPNHPCVEDCSNGVDDDFDNYADCQDLDCLQSCDPACWGGEICDDATDNDGDGLTDCNDCECYLQGPCLGEAGHCDDFLDNDLDSFTDCDDPECWTDPACVASESICDDYVDNDFDGMVDCKDLDCANDSYCTGLCDVIQTLGCGDQAPGITVVGAHTTDILHDYPACNLLDQFHPEEVFGLPSPGAGFSLEVDVTVTSGTVQNVVVLQDTAGGACAFDTPCVGYSTPGTPVVVPAADGAAYYAVVESNGITSDFEISVQCTATVEDCATIDTDTDGDGLMPCDDPDCDSYAFPDNDGDGFDVCDDCWDGDATVYPGAPEIACDEVDQDCDGADLTDLDDDGDGFISDDCLGGTDCDDSDPDINPDAAEVCDDGIDNDCDGDIDMDDDDCDEPGDDDTGDDDDTTGDDDDDTGDDDDGDDDIGEEPCEGCCCKDCDIQQTQNRSGLSLTLIAAALAILARRRSHFGRSSS